MIASYELKDHALEISFIGTRPSLCNHFDNLTWNRQACSACSKYSFVRRNTNCIKNVSV